MSNITFVCPDVHHPFSSWEKLKELSDVVKSAQKNKSDTVSVIQIGDIIDAMAWSRYPKGPDAPNAQFEWNQTELAMHKMAELFPKMKILFGNHDLRFMKKAVEAQLPKQMVKGLEAIFDFPGWDWHISTKPYIKDGIMYIHGDEFPISPSNMGLAASRVGMSLVFGHTHQMGIAWQNVLGKKIFAMNAGCIIDEEAIAFSYANKNPRRCMQGYGIIIDGKPHLETFV